MAKEKMKKNVRRLCLTLLAINAFSRLMFLKSYLNPGIVTSDPTGITVIITGAIMLAVGIMILVLKIKNEDYITGFLLAMVTAIDLGISLTRLQNPIANPFLWISAISLLSLAAVIHIEEKGKTSIIPKIKTSIAFIVPILFLSIFTNAVKASTIVDHANFSSIDSNFTVTTYVYQYSDSLEGKDFYGFWILLHTDSIAYFDWIERLELYVPGGTFDDWEPKIGLTSGGDISITPTGPKVSIALPLSDVSVGGEYTDVLSWFVNPLGSNPQDMEFAAKVWIPAGSSSSFQWRILVKAWSAFGILGTTVFFWHDTAEYSTIPLQTLTITTEGHGTTNDVPGTYEYQWGSVVSIEAKPDLGYKLQHWEVNGEQVEAKNPLEITIKENTTIKAVFSPAYYRIFIWVSNDFYWNGYIYKYIWIGYYTMDWELVYYRWFVVVRKVG